MLRDTAFVLLSNLAVNLTTFFVLSLAPRFLATDGFANLSLMIAACFFGTVLLDLGLNVSAVKKYSERRDQGFLSALLVVKGGLVTASLLAIPLLFEGGMAATAGAVVLSTAALTWWAGTRAVEQARQDFSRFARQNLLFAALRAVLGGSALLTHDWLVVALAVFVAPSLLVAAFDLRRLRRLLVLPGRDVWREIAGYSRFTYLSSLFYNAALYVPQLFISARLGPIDVGTFGLILLFLGPLSLVNTSLRTFVLPKIAASEVTQAGLIADRRVRIATLIVAGAALAGIALASVGLDLIYGSRFPELARLFAIYVGIYVAVSVLGPLNMEVHRLGAAGLEASVNGVRLLAAVVLLHALGTTLDRIVLISALVMLAGEIALFLLSRRLAAAR